MQHPKRVRSASFRKLSGFFRAVENSAMRIRKLLRSARVRRRASKVSVAMDDAVALATLIERLAKYGQTLAAAEAMDLAERLEPMFDQLRAEVDSLLAS